MSLQTLSLNNDKYRKKIKKSALYTRGPNIESKNIPKLQSKGKGIIAKIKGFFTNQSV